MNSFWLRRCSFCELSAGNDSPLKPLCTRCSLPESCSRRGDNNITMFRRCQSLSKSKGESEKQGEKVGSLGLWSVEEEWQRFKGSCCVVILMLLGGMIQRPHISSGAPLICWMSLRQLNPAKYGLRPTPSIKSLSKRAGDGPHQTFDTLPLGPSLICTTHLCLAQNQRLIYSFCRLVLTLWLVSSSISASWLNTRICFPIGAIREWKVSCRLQLTAKRFRGDGNTWGKNVLGPSPTHVETAVWAFTNVVRDLKRMHLHCSASLWRWSSNFSRLKEVYGATHIAISTW